MESRSISRVAGLQAGVVPTWQQYCLHMLLHIGRRQRTVTAISEIKNISLAQCSFARAAAKKQRPATHPDPGDDATQVGAHGVEAVALDAAVLGDDQVGGVTLRTKETGRRRQRAAWVSRAGRGSHRPEMRRSRSQCPIKYEK